MALIAVKAILISDIDKEYKEGDFPANKKGHTCLTYQTVFGMILKILKGANVKASIFLISLLLSSSVFARQYIQCGDRNSWDGAVINLDEDNSTLFMTNGVHLPDEDRVEMLKDLFFDSKDQTHSTFITNQGKIKDYVKVPNNKLGKYSSSFEVIMGHLNTENNYSYERVMYCFSAIYNH